MLFFVHLSVVTSGHMCVELQLRKAGVAQSSSLPEHIYFKANSETHTREVEAGRLTG